MLHAEKPKAACFPTQQSHADLAMTTCSALPYNQLTGTVPSSLGSMGSLNALCAPGPSMRAHSRRALGWFTHPLTIGRV